MLSNRYDDARLWFLSQQLSSWSFPYHMGTQFGRPWSLSCYCTSFFQPVLNFLFMCLLSERRLLQLHDGAADGRNSSPQTEKRCHSKQVWLPRGETQTHAAEVFINEKTSQKLGWTCHGAVYEWGKSFAGMFGNSGVGTSGKVGWPGKLWCRFAQNLTLLWKDWDQFSATFFMLKY